MSQNIAVRTSDVSLRTKRPLHSGWRTLKKLNICRMEGSATAVRSWFLETPRFRETLDNSLGTMQAGVLTDVGF